jgi:competence protein ComGF
MVIKRNDGSLLVETLLSFSCFLFLISFLPFIIKGVHIPKYTNGTLMKPLEVHLFFEQLSLELRQAKSISLAQNSLILSKDNGDTVIIERYGGFIRRRVNYSGHEVMLTNVKDISFTLKTNGVTIEVVGRNGSTIEKSLSLTPYRSVEM